MKLYFEIEVPENIREQIDNSSKIRDTADYVTTLINDTIHSDMGKEVIVNGLPNYKVV